MDLKSRPVCKVDTFSITTRSTPEEVCRRVVDEFFPGVDCVAGRGGNGYECGASLMLGEQKLGWMNWGGNGNTTYLYIDGQGCGAVRDWPAVAAALRALVTPRLTRIDLAADFYCGSVTYERVMAAYEEGFFTPSKSPVSPKCLEHKGEQGGQNLGRTVYFGDIDNGKRARCYEKGLEQIGRARKKYPHLPVPDELRDWPGCPDGTDPFKWFRIEVEYKHSKDRPLDFGMMESPDPYWAGSYPFCEMLLPAISASRPACIPVPAVSSIYKLAVAARNTYGSFVHSLREIGLTDSQIVGLLDTGKHNRRLEGVGVLNAQAEEIRVGLVRLLDSLNHSVARSASTEPASDCVDA